MVPDVIQQVHRYAEHVDSMVPVWTADEIIAAPPHVEHLRVTKRRGAPVFVAVAAFVAVVVAIGSVAVLLGGGESSVVDQPITTHITSTTPSATLESLSALDLADQYYEALNRADLVAALEVGPVLYDEGRAAIHSYNAVFDWTCEVGSDLTIVCEERVTDAFYGPAGLIHEATAVYRIEDGKLDRTRGGVFDTDGPSGDFLSYLQEFDQWLWENHPDTDWLWVAEKPGGLNIHGEQPCCLYMNLEPERAEPIKGLVQEFIDDSHYPVMTPDATASHPTVAPPEVSGQWTLYSADGGLPGGPMSGVAIGGDGTVWAGHLASVGELYRFDGAEWSPVGRPLRIGNWRWMVATPEGRVAMALANGQIVLLEDNQWRDVTEQPLEMSAVVTAVDGPQILGYAQGAGPIAIRFTDEGIDAKTTNRGPAGRPSNLSVWDTVDVDSLGNAWYGALEGAWRFDGESMDLFEFGVRGECCALLAVDAHDNVWVIPDPGEDVFRLSPSGEQTRFTADDGIDSLNQEGIPTLVTTSDGAVWVFGRAGTAAHFDGTSWTSFPSVEAQNAGIPNARNLSGFGVVDGADGSTWTVQLDGGTAPAIHRFFDGRWKAVPTDAIQWGEVGGDAGTLGMAVGPDGTLWIPTTTGVAAFHPNSEPSS